MNVSYPKEKTDHALDEVHMNVYFMNNVLYIFFN